MSARKNIGWTVAATAVGSVLQLIQVSIAARYLTSLDFGVLAIVNVIAWIILAFQDMGMSSYCIHLGNVSRPTASTLFWISSTLGLIGALLLLVLSYPVSFFYEMPALLYLMPILAVNLFVTGVGAQYQANYIRVFRSKDIAAFELVSKVSSFCAVVYLVVNGWGVLSIVVGTVLISLVKIALMVIFSDKEWHPTLQFDRRVAPGALKYGLFQSAGMVVNQLRTQADQLIVGRALGAELLGVYSLAKELISYPLRFMQPLLSRITLPALASVQSNPEALQAAFLKSVKRTAYFSSAVYLSLGVFSATVVNVLYGDQFDQVAPIVLSMCVFGFLRPLGLSIGMLAQATGKTSSEFYWNVRSALFSLPIFLSVAVFYPSIEGFAFAVSAVQVCLTFLAYPLFLRSVKDVGFFSYVLSWFPQLMVVVLIVGASFWMPLGKIDIRPMIDRVIAFGLSLV